MHLFRNDSVIHYGGVVAVFEFISWLSIFLSQRFFAFEWDEGNATKSLRKHGINTEEAEEIFCDSELLILGLQIFPIAPEERYAVIGKTETNKILFVCFTIRNYKIRIISVRNANKKERKVYES